MRLSVFVGVLAIAGGVAMGKLLHDRDVAQTTPPSPTTPTPAPALPSRPRRSPSPSPSRPAPLTAAEQKQLDEPRQMLAQGRFEEARLATLAVETGTSPSLRAAMTALSERATLFSVLTRGIRRHPFVNATDLVEVTLASGATHTARVLRETDDTLTLSLADGREIEVHQERVVKRTRLGADAWAAKKRAEIEKEQGELADAGSLEVFRVAFEAFETGFLDMGVPLLERALALPGGGAVVDVYGAGDLSVLHRAQERLREEKGFPAGSELAQARAPRARPTPADASTPATPAPATPTNAAAASPEPEPEPAETDEPARASDIDRLNADGHWKQAQATYSKAVAIYRESFAGNTAKEKAGIRDALELLEQTQGLLDQLPRDMGDANSTIDTFFAKVNALLRDVKKRKMATGS